MTWEENHRLFHNWHLTHDNQHAPFCMECGAYDAVDYCATYHDESCHCVNPACPPRPEEQEAADKLAKEIHDKALDKVKYLDDKIAKSVAVATAYKASKYGLGGVVTKTFTYGNRSITAQHNTAIPYTFPIFGNHPDTKAVTQVEDMSVYTDPVTGHNHFTMKCKCAWHGVYIITVKNTPVLTQNFYYPWADVITEGFRCPGCNKQYSDMQKQKKLISSAQNLMEDISCYDIVQTVQQQMAEDVAKTVDSLINREPP